METFSSRILQETQRVKSPFGERTNELFMPKSPTPKTPPPGFGPVPRLNLPTSNLVEKSPVFTRSDDENVPPSSLRGSTAPTYAEKDFQVHLASQGPTCDVIPMNEADLNRTSGSTVTTAAPGMETSNTSFPVGPGGDVEPDSTDRITTPTTTSGEAADDTIAGPKKAFKKKTRGTRGGRKNREKRQLLVARKLNSLLRDEQLRCIKNELLNLEGQNKSKRIVYSAEQIIAIRNLPLSKGPPSNLPSIPVIYTAEIGSPTLNAESAVEKITEICERIIKMDPNTQVQGIEPHFVRKERIRSQNKASDVSESLSCSQTTTSRDLFFGSRLNHSQISESETGMNSLSSTRDNDTTATTMSGSPDSAAHSSTPVDMSQPPAPMRTASSDGNLTSAEISVIQDSSSLNESDRKKTPSPIIETPSLSAASPSTMDDKSSSASTSLPSTSEAGQTKFKMRPPKLADRPPGINMLPKPYRNFDFLPEGSNHPNMYNEAYYNNYYTGYCMLIPVYPYQYQPMAYPSYPFPYYQQTSPTESASTVSSRRSSY